MEIKYKYKGKEYNLYYKKGYLGRTYRSNNIDDYKSINNNDKTKNKTITNKYNIFK